MKIAWGTFKRPDDSVYRQIEVSRDSDRKLFDRLVVILEGELRGHWSAKVDWIDQRYYDLDVDDGRITLHLEHYLGITIYPADGAEANQASLDLLEAAFDILAACNPA